MTLVDLPTHPYTGLRAIGVVRGRPVWPVMGAADDDSDAGRHENGGNQEPHGKPVDSGNSTGEPDRAYPADTPIAEMTAAQQVNYWKAQARKHEGTAKARADYDALKTKAQQYDSLEAASRTEAERAVEAAKAEGRNDGAIFAAGQRIVGLLVSRGKTEEEADDIVDDLNLPRYVKDGKPDREAIAKAIDRLAPKNAGEAQIGPDLGQGRRGAAPAGADMNAVMRRALGRT